MKNPITAVIMLLTTLALAATLTACGGENTSGPEPTEAARPTSTVQMNPPATEPDTTPGPRTETPAATDQAATNMPPRPTATTARTSPAPTTGTTGQKPAGTPEPEPDPTPEPIPEDPEPRPQVANPSADTDRQALLALREALDHPEFNEQWDPEEDPLTWSYVDSSGPDNGRVRSITLEPISWQNQTTVITREALAHMGDLTELRKIFIREAILPDGIAPELGNLSNLEKLWLSAEVTGHIPAFLASMPSLQKLVLTGSSFTRHRFPHDLLANTAITNISLHGLMLEADINTVLTPETMPPDRYITLYGNKLTGQIPKELDDLLLDRPHVKIDGSHIQGCVSSFLKDNQAVMKDIMVCPYGDSPDHQSMIALRDAMTLIEEQDTPQNKPFNWKEEDLPLHQWDGVLLNRNGRVVEIKMSYGSSDDQTPQIFEARLPEEIGTMTELRHLYLSGQQILSPLPESFRHLRNLRNLNLQNTLLDEPLPNYFGTFTNLTLLNLLETDITYEPGHPFFDLPQLEEVKFDGVRLYCGEQTRDNPLFTNLKPCPSPD